MSVLEEQMAAWERWKAGDREAAGRQFFDWYKRLIAKWARRSESISKNLSFEDYEQLGKMAICKALDNYDPKAGGKIPYWIELRVKWALMESVRLQNGAMSIANSRPEKALQLNFTKDTNRMLQQGFSWNDIRETLAAKYRVHPLDIDALYYMRKGSKVIVEEFDEEGDDTTFLVADVPQAEVGLTQARASEALQELFDDAGLKPRERQILLARFDTDDNRELALEKIAQQWGLSRERVRRLITDSLEQVAEAAKKRGLAFEDLW